MYTIPCIAESILFFKMAKLACLRGLQFAVVLAILTVPSSPQLLVDDRCLARCESLRPAGVKESFKLQCSDDIAYVTRGSEKVHCREDCNLCKNANMPKCTIDSIDDIRDFDYTYEFFCPKTDMPDGDCKDRCDSHRPQGSTDGYTLNCEETYGEYSSEAQVCRSNCERCPHWVCDPKKDNNVYHCPTKSSTCTDQCDKVREFRTGLGLLGRKNFYFFCSDQFYMTDQEKDLCTQTCGDCPPSMCDPNRYSNDHYECPALSFPTPPPREYDGKCKERCNKLRFGGHGAYSFKCQELFDDPVERDACYDDCDTCPEYVCKLKGQKTLGQFNCPEDKEFRERMEEERNREEERERSRKNLLESLQGYLIAIICGILGFILISALAVCGARKNRRKKAMQLQQGMQQEQNGMPSANQGQFSPGQGLPLQPQPGDSYMSAPPEHIMKVPPNLNSPGTLPNPQFGNEN